MEEVGVREGMGRSQSITVSNNGEECQPTITFQNKKRECPSEAHLWQSGEAEGEGRKDQGFSPFGARLIASSLYN